MPYANNKGAGQTAHLISAFVVRCLDSIIHLLAIAEISRPQLVSVAVQAGLCLTWSQLSKTGFLVTWLILNLQILLPSEGLKLFSFTSHLVRTKIPIN